MSAEAAFNLFVGFLIVLVAFMFYLIIWVAPQEAIKQDRFAQNCYTKEGVVLKTTTGSSRNKHYEYICVKKEMVIE